MVTNLAAKSMAALSQLYAIFVFSSVYTAVEASIVFVLLGYAIWIQILEFGLAQIIQNKLNRREISLSDSYVIIVTHYGAMLLFAIISISIPEIFEFLLSKEQYESGLNATKAFSIGMALMIIATSNVVIQRLLIVANLGLKANILLCVQAVFSMTSLAICQRYGVVDLLMSTIAYLAPAVLVYVPMIVQLLKKLARRRSLPLSVIRLSLVSDAAGFWGLNVLSSIFLGADYYFVAHYLSGDEIVSYHFTARFFFFSYVAYFSYVQHRAKNLTYNTIRQQPFLLRKIVTRSVMIGLSSVIIVSAGVLVFDFLGWFVLIMERRLVMPSMVLAATLYFSMRVFRDTGLVVLWNLGAKSLLYKIYFLEVLLGLCLLTWLSTELAGIGVFLAMALTVFVSASIVLYAVSQIIKSQQVTFGG